MANTAGQRAALIDCAMVNTAGQRHDLIDCYGQHRMPVARSNWLLWPTPQTGVEEFAKSKTFFDGESGMLFGATLWEYYAEYYKTRDNPNVSG